MKTLNLVISKVPESDVNTGDPIRETGFHNIKEFDETNIPSQEFLYFIKLGDKHCTVFGYGDAFTIGTGILNSVSNSILHRVKSKTAKILISWPMESFLQDTIFKAMHEYFDHHNIPRSQIIYLSASPNGTELYDDYCLRNSIKDKMVMEYIPWYLYSSAMYRSDPYVPGKRKKRFFILNRRMHIQRSFLFLKLFKENLLDKCYISFPKYHPDSKETFSNKVLTSYMRYFRDHGITDEDVYQAEKLLPLEIDINDWQPYPLPIRTPSLDKFYQRSLFSLVSETYFYSKVIHLTEKTFKPIINRHPFIMFASAHTLEKIKSFGFKTFDSIIDESYDKIEDDEKRFYTIFKLIEDICSWDKEKVADVTNQIKEIVDYNYELLHSRSPIELNNFIEKYGV